MDTQTLLSAILRTEWQWCRWTRWDKQTDTVLRFRTKTGKDCLELPDSHLLEMIDMEGRSRARDIEVEAIERSITRVDFEVNMRLWVFYENVGDDRVWKIRR